MDYDEAGVEMQGSPPHVRGKVIVDLVLTERHRITPAYAGKSRTAPIPACWAPDHPRVCGEKRPASVSFRSFSGSPPHMRGKDKDFFSSMKWYRITPAHAGKSLITAGSHTLEGDHPRTCGEKNQKDPKKLKTRGSPPHMRGKDVLCFCQCAGHGITPAHAGKRLKRSRSIVPHAAIVPLFPSVCNKPAGSDGSPAGHDAPPFLPIENAVPASPAYNLRSL